MKGEGAIVFLIAFFVVLIITFAYPEMPPGRQIYSALGTPDTDYLVAGIPATTLIIAIFNGIIYGVIVWLIFTFGIRAIRRRRST
jgi:ABC-type xylose transport system permease subunit